MTAKYNRDTQVKDADVFAAYYSTLAKNRQRVYGTAKNHRCKPGVCRLWEYIPPRGKILSDPIYVCTNSNTLHVCGVKCQYTEDTPKTDGYVCILTGKVVSQVYINHITPRNDDDNDNEQKNDHYSVFGGQLKYAKKKNVELRYAASQILIYNKLILLFTHATRDSILQSEIQRFQQTIIRKLRANITHRWTYTELTNLITDRYENHRSYLNTPMKSHDPRLLKLATAINTFWHRIQSENQRTGHGRTVFVALCVCMLSTGYTQDNITIFPKIPWVAAHAPDRSILNRICPTLKPKNIHALWKRLKPKLICRKTNTPLYNKMFPAVE